MASKKAQVQSVLDVIAASVDKIEVPVTRVLLPALQSAQREVESDLRAWLSSQHGADTFTAQRYRNVLVNLDESISRVGATAGIAERELRKNSAFVSRLSFLNLKKEWNAFSQIFEGTVQPIEIDEAALFARGKRTLWPQFKTSAKKYGGRAEDRLKQEFAISRARNETIYEMTNRLERRFPDIFRGNRWDAERLSRTETMNAYSQNHLDGIIEAHREDPDIMSRWDSSPDLRRCPACASLDGQVVNTAEHEQFVAKWMTLNKKGQVKQHVLKVVTAPLHPCCRCVVTAWKESWSAYARHGANSERLAA